MEQSEDYHDISEENHLLTIWTYPRQTLEYILTYCPDKYVTGLFMLSGIARAISRASLKNAGDDMSTVAVLGLCVFIGIAFGWMSFYVYAFFLSVTGRWINGKAEGSQFRTVLAWAMVPTVLSLILVIPELIIFGDDLFRSEPEHTGTFVDIMWMVFGLLEITLAIWTIVILIKGIALIQKFSTGKAIANALLPGVLIIIPIVLIVFVIQLFK